MKIIKYKRIKNKEFVFSKNMILINKDQYENDDLKELIKELLKSGRKNDDILLKYQEFDDILDSKNEKIEIIPSFFDFQNDLFDGKKSVFKNLLKLIIKNNYTTNETLQTIKILFDNFNFNTEFNDVIKIKNEIAEKTNLELKIFNKDILDELFIEVIFSEIFSDDEIVDKDNIKFTDAKKIYLILIKYLIINNIDKNVIPIFMEPYLGMSKDEKVEINNMLKLLDKKIIICTEASNMEMNFTEQIVVFGNEFNIDFLSIKDDFMTYKIFFENEISEKELYDNIVNETKNLIKFLLINFNYYEILHNELSLIQNKILNNNF